MIRKVKQLEGDSLSTFMSSKKPLSVDPRGTPKSIGSLDSGGSGNVSIGSQDAIIEQLRQKHKQIVSEGRQRLVGKLVKHSLREVRANQYGYPFERGNAMSTEQRDKQSLRTIKQLGNIQKNSGSMSLMNSYESIERATLDDEDDLQKSQN